MTNPLFEGNEKRRKEALAKPDLTVAQRHMINNLYDMERSFFKMLIQSPPVTSNDLASLGHEYCHAMASQLWFLATAMADFINQKEGGPATPVNCLDVLSRALDSSLDIHVSQMEKNLGDHKLH